MPTPRRAVALTLSLAVYASLALVPSAPAQGQALDDVRRRELQALVDVVRAAVRDQRVPATRPFQWSNDFFKSVDAQTYVPFTLVIDPARITSPTIAVYVWVTEHVPTDQPAAPDGDSRQSQAEADRGEDVSTAFEDAYFIDVDPSERAAHRIRRAIVVPGGEYDVYVALKGMASVEDTEASATVMLLKQELTVPDFWDTALATSTVILAQRVEVLSAQLSLEEQVANPYTIGMTRIVPVEDAIFTGGDQLSLMFLVYNPRSTTDNKPDVTVEYRLYRRTSAGEEYFNQTSPQYFNAETLPVMFDGSAGHQIVAGRTVPLSFFQEGDYRLEITVTDNVSDASVIRDVMFTVTGP